MSSPEEQAADFAGKNLGLNAPTKVISAGESYSDNGFYAVRAYNGDLQVDSLGTPDDSDDIPAGTIQQDAVMMARFTEISVASGSSGIAVIYLLN